MFNQDQDMQKRVMIFFLIVSVFMIGFVIAENLFAEDKKEQKVVQQTQSTTTKENEQKGTSTSQAEPIKTINTKVVGSYDILLNNQRLTSDNLKDVVEIKTKYGKIKISKVGARIISVYLDRYKIDTIPKIAKDNRIFPAEIITTDPKLTAILNFSKYDVKKDGNKYIFFLKKNNVEIKKVFVINPDETISLYLPEKKGLENVGIAVINGITPPKEERGFGHRGAIIKTQTDLIKIDADIKQTQVIRDNIIWAGEENKYFLQLIANKLGFTTSYVIPLGNETTLTLSEIRGDLDGFFYGGAKLYSLLGEITEKYKKLWGVDLALRDTIDFGIFGFLGKPLFLVLHFIYNYVHNWGLAIIILTVLLRIILFPLNHKSLMAMKRMADLAPEIQKLQKKYKDDPQKLQQEMMKLYAEHGANPMSGCLPILVQIPIFIALYNVLMVDVELKNVPFLWIPDLSQHDPYYILPILMGLSMVAQQWITPSSDKNQKFIMYGMAALFTFLFMNFPAGLVLYWLTNNILGLIQSLIVNKMLNKQKQKQNAST